MHDRILEDLSEPELVVERGPVVRVEMVTTLDVWQRFGDRWVRVYEKPIFPAIGRED